MHICKMSGQISVQTWPCVPEALTPHTMFCLSFLVLSDCSAVSGGLYPTGEFPPWGVVSVVAGSARDWQSLELKVSGFLATLALQASFYSVCVCVWGSFCKEADGRSGQEMTVATKPPSWH